MGRKLNVGDEVKILKPHPFHGNTGLIVEYSTKRKDADFPYIVHVEQNGEFRYKVGCRDMDLEVIG